MTLVLPDPLGAITNHRNGGLGRCLEINGWLGSSHPSRTFLTLKLDVDAADAMFILTALKINMASAAKPARVRPKPAPTPAPTKSKLTPVQLRDYISYLFGGTEEIQGVTMMNEWLRRNDTSANIKKVKDAATSKDIFVKALYQARIETSGPVTEDRVRANLEVLMKADPRWSNLSVSQQATAIDKFIVFRSPGGSWTNFRNDYINTISEYVPPRQIEQLDRGEAEAEADEKKVYEADEKKVYEAEAEAEVDEKKVYEADRSVATAVVASRPPTHPVPKRPVARAIPLPSGLGRTAAGAAAAGAAGHPIYPQDEEAKRRQQAIMDSIAASRGVPTPRAVELSASSPPRHPLAKVAMPPTSGRRWDLFSDDEYDQIETLKSSTLLRPNMDNMDQVPAEQKAAIAAMDAKQQEVNADATKLETQKNIEILTAGLQELDRQLAAKGLNSSQRDALRPTYLKYANSARLQNLMRVMNIPPDQRPDIVATLSKVLDPLREQEERAKRNLTLGIPSTFQYGGPDPDDPSETFPFPSADNLNDDGVDISTVSLRKAEDNPDFREIMDDDGQYDYDENMLTTPQDRVARARIAVRSSADRIKMERYEMMRYKTITQRAIDNAKHKASQRPDGGLAVSGAMKSMIGLGDSVKRPIPNNAFPEYRGYREAYLASTPQIAAVP